MGHVHATLGLARRLSDRSHNVYFGATGSAVGIIRGSGFQCLDLPWLESLSGFVTELTEQIGEASITRKQREIIVEKAALATLRGAAKVLAEIDPDLVIFDPFLLTIYPAFHALGTRAVALSTKPLLTSDPLVPPYICHVVPQDDINGRLQVITAWMVTRMRYYCYLLSCAIKEQFFGLSHRSLLVALSRLCDFPLRIEARMRPVAFDVRFASVPELILHAREFEFPRAKTLTDPVAYIGPCVDLQRSSLPWSPPPGKGPLVYCNFGTVHHQMDVHKKTAIRQVIAAVQSLTDWRLVVSISDHSLVKFFRKELADNTRQIQIETWVPQMAVLKQATVLVTHAGANSTKEAIVSGVPILACPYKADQPGIGARIVYHRLGIRAFINKNSKEILSQKLLRLTTEPEFRIASDRMRAAFARYDEYCVAERFLEGMAEGMALGSIGH